MNQTIDLLREVVRTARDGAEGIQLIMDKTVDTALRQFLFSEKERYTDIERDAGKKLIDMGSHALPETLMNQAGMRMGVAMDTMMDNSSSHLAELLIQGNNMGIVELTKRQKSCSEADRESIDLCNRMIKLQQDSIEQAKHYLT